jgi:hypothetical protein
VTPSTKQVLSAAGLCVSIIGSIGAGAFYIGGKIYDFSKAQTSMLEHLRSAEGQILGLKTDISTSVAAQDHSREALKNDIVPRIDKLDTAVIETKTEAAAAKAKLEDFKETLDEVRGLAKANLAVSQSHSQDITATRQDVAATRSALTPRNEEHPRQ